MPDSESLSGPSILPVGWRFKVGIVLFVLALVPYGLLPPFLFPSLPVATIATLVATGAILNKVLIFSAIMVLGKAGFAHLKAKLFRRLSPPKEVSRNRYRVGLVMFCIPFLESFGETYLSHIAPHLVKNRMWVDIAMDGLLVASVFVLGGRFWDKVRALFIADARAVFPEDSGTTA